MTSSTTTVNPANQQTDTAPVPPHWHHFARPTEAEMAYMKEEWAIPADYVRHSLDIRERARSERNNGTTLIVLRVPYFQGNIADVPYITMTLGVILTERQIITICPSRNRCHPQLNKLRADQVNAGTKLLVEAPEASNKPTTTLSRSSLADVAEQHLRQ